MGGWFKKEVHSMQDMQGLRMRIPGMGGKAMARMGVAVQNIPGGEIYTALERGAIDATEWVGPWNDAYLKLYEAAKYYYFPGVHEPGSMLAVGTNKSWFESLSKTDQMIIQAAATMENDMMLSEYNAKNGAALEKLIREQGVQLREFNDDVYDAFGDAAEEVFEETRAHSDIANRIHQSFAKARREVGAWNKISDQAYVSQRNRVLGV